MRNKDDDQEKSEEKTIDEIVIDTLSQGLLDPEHGSLLRHEFAYVMGQLRDERVSFYHSA